MKRKTITPSGYNISVSKIGYGTYRWILFLHEIDVCMEHVSHSGYIYDEFEDRNNLEPNYKKELERETAEWIAAMNGTKLIFKD
jgi:hypothetical protein